MSPPSPTSKPGKIAIIAPEGFVEHAVSENVYAGTAMSRRAGYMYGAVLARGPQGQVGAGLGQTTSAGEVGMIAPTDSISTTGETRTIDGVEIEFQMAPGTEAPAEMHFYFPKHRALCMAENATHNLHNLLTLRGALVRDPHVWANYLSEAIESFGSRTDVAFASHHWPTWGAENVVEFLATQRDLYAYLHDQTLRLLNHGYTGAEIAELFELPPELEKAWNTHGYYGSVSHNVKAIYQRYMGWFDGNPARLWPHPPEALRRATWMRSAASSVSSSSRRPPSTPAISAGRPLCSTTRCSSTRTILRRAPFTPTPSSSSRTGQRTARGATSSSRARPNCERAISEQPTGTAAPAIVAQLSPEQLFDSLSLSVNGPKAWDLALALDVTFTDLDANYRLTLRNGALTSIKRAARADADATLTLTKPRLIAMAGGDLTSPGVEITGDASALQTLLGVLEQGDPSFNIVTP